MQEDLSLVQIRDDFYRDHFGRVIIIMVSLAAAIAAVIALSLYLYLSKPPPINFAVDQEWRVQPAVPLDQPYLTKADLLQWVTNTVSTIFVLNFINYNDQLNTFKRFFTDDGWKVFLNQLNIYVNYNNVQTNRLFVNGVPAGAPSEINQGLLAGRYGWWVQIPVSIYFVSYNRNFNQTLTLQILIIRVPTLNNLDGYAIDNVIVVNSSGTQQTNG